MPVYEVEIHGKVYEVEADSVQAASQAVQLLSGVRENSRQGTMLGSFNKGLAEFAGMFADPAAATYNAVAKPLGGAPITFPDGRSANAIANAGSRVGIDTKPMPGVMGRTAENMGAGLPFALMGGPVSQVLGRTFGDAVSSFGSATGESVGRNMSESEIGAGVGSVVGGFTPAGLSASAKVALRGGPQRGDEMRDRLTRFNQQGIDPSVSQATGSRAWGTVESGLASTFGGTGTARNFGIRQQDQAQNALIRAVSGGAMDKGTAGRMIREGVFGNEGYVEMARARTQANYQRVWEVADSAAPELGYSTRTMLDDLPDAESLSGIFVRPKIRQIHERMRASGPVEVGELDELRKWVGHELGEPVLNPDISRRDLKRLYGALSDDIQRNLERQGPEALQAFNVAQDDFRKHMVYMEGIVNKLSKIDADEKVFQAIAGGRVPDTAVLSQAKAVLDEGQWNTFVRTFTNRLGAVNPSQELPELTFSTESFLTNFHRMQREAPDALDLLYGRGPLRNDIERIATSFEDLRRARVYTNPSQSAGTGIVAASLQSIPMILGAGVAGAVTSSGGGGVAAAASGLAAVGAGYGGTRAMSNLMHNQRFVHWLARATEITPAQYSAHVARLRSMGEGAEQDFFNELADEINERLSNGN